MQNVSDLHLIVTSTSLATGTGLTGGPISSATGGTISLADTTVATGSYIFASITVDAKGRLSAASSGPDYAANLTSINVRIDGILSGLDMLNMTSMLTGDTLNMTVGTLISDVMMLMATNATVREINTGTGLVGGPITQIGTISLTNTAVTAGSYNFASFTVDQQGRLIAATSGTPLTSVTRWCTCCRFESCSSRSIL